MNLAQMINELSELIPQFGMRVRVENGRFAGGPCTVNGEQLIVLNKRHPPERQFAVLARALRLLPLEDVYLKPGVRRALEEAWEREREEAHVAASDEPTED